MEEKRQKEPRFDLENKKGKARMKKQAIGRDGMGWEGKERGGGGVLERTLPWQELWKIKVQNRKVL